MRGKTRRFRRLAATTIAASTLTSGLALGAVQTPFPGVVLVTSGPHAMAIADLCAAGVSVRATRYDERKATAQGWATKAGVNADVAINADFFDLPATTYVIGRARGAGQDWPNQNKEPRPFWQFGPAIAEMIGANPSAAATEIVGAHNVIIRDGRSQAPIFDGDAVILTAHRRTGIGISASRTKLYLFASDASMAGGAMANAMIALAAEGGAPYIDIASNQDGGGSSMMYVRGQGQVIDSSRLVANHLGILARGSGASPHCQERPPTQTTFPLPTACGRIDPEHGLDKVHAVTSCDGRFSLVQQDDGNLVLYAPNGKATWSTATNARDGGHALQMQADGNLVLYAPWGRPVFETRSSGHAGAFVALQDDGNLVVYDKAQALWSSQTNDPPDLPPANAPTTKLPTAPAACGRIGPGEGLARGRSVTSCDRRFTLKLQDDGNVVLQESDGKVIWQSQTTAALGYAFGMTEGGDLQVQSPYANMVWSSRTGGHPGVSLSIQDDGNLVIYGAENTVLWNAGSSDPGAPPPRPDDEDGGSRAPSGPGAGPGDSPSEGSNGATDASDGGGCATGGSSPGIGHGLAGLAIAGLGAALLRRRSRRGSLEA